MCLVQGRVTLALAFLKPSIRLQISLLKLIQTSTVTKSLLVNGSVWMASSF
ncbi:hypothetical protein REPUB_Repub07fG0163300 [Reevesia pubescens]